MNIPKLNPEKEISLTTNEIYYVLLLLAADQSTYIDRVEHAKSHGESFSSIRGECIGSVIKKLGAAE